MFQLKEQDKNPEKNLNEVELTKLLDKEFKEMVIQMLTELRRKWIYTGRTSTKRQKKKVPNKSHRVEEYNN